MSEVHSICVKRLACAEYRSCVHVLRARTACGGTAHGGTARCGTAHGGTARCGTARCGTAHGRAAGSPHMTPTRTAPSPGY